MTTYFRILVAAITLSVAGLSSCKKAYESEPLGQQISPEIAFDPHDSAGVYAMRYLLTTYTEALPNNHNRIGNSYLDAASDDAISSQSGIPEVQKIVTGAYTSVATNGDNVWSKYYTAIRDATVFSVNINRVPMKELLPNGKSARAAYRSEARFLRAFLYFELIKRYGGVPLLGDTIRGLNDNIQLPRSSFADCVTFIVNECNDIKDSLRTADMVNATTYGRITKGAAMALKAKVLLYAASPLYNGGNIDPANPLTGYLSADNNRWKLAADAAKELIDLGAYNLMPSFTSVFITQAKPVGTNTETIFWRQNGTNTSVETNNGPVGFSSAGANGLTSPTQNLVDAFTTDQGKTITDISSNYNPNDLYSHRDPRLANTIFYNGAMWLNRAVETFEGGQDKPGGTLQQTKTSYYMRKFMGNFEAVNGSPVYSNTVHDFIYFRYAEVLLNYAEALNEFSGPSTGVYQVIYDLRKRAGIIAGANNNYGVAAGLTKDEMRKIIQNERHVELAFEEHRFFDIRRSKIAGDVFAKPLKGLTIQKSSGGQINYNPVNVLTPVFRNPQMYFYPIPYNEVIKNSQMVQNPQW
ncbi:MAG: RagB/SusD protein [Ferruginibacter sp.]|nr:RagB/SusD protein [Ferruginibacter sp.]